MTGRFDIEWRDSGREPQCPPNPEYPNGIDLDVSMSGQSCDVSLPYPAKRCGAYIVTCKLCGLTVAVTTAGRTDDPRSLKVACKSMASA